MDIQEEFYSFFTKEAMDGHQERPVLLAVSGGLDSSVMAELFFITGLEFAIAHVNFQLRGNDSDQDEQFVQTMADRMGVPFFSKRFHTLEIAEEKGWSIQEAARNLRYAWFAELVHEHSFAGVCTAHHQHDALETALLNFTRGTSLPGLSGIAKVKIFEPDSTFSGLRVLRPMLFTDRKALERFALEKGITWREDASNALTDYSRNLIRHNVIPVLESLNPNLPDTAARNMRRIRSADRNLDFLLQQFVCWESGRITLDKVGIQQLPSPRQALRQLLKPYGFNAEQTRQMSEQLEDVGAEWISAKGYKLLMDRKGILLYTSDNEQLNHPTITIQADDLMVRLPDETRLFLMLTDRQAEDEIKQSDEYQIRVDASKLHFPLHLRRWQPGDSFQPLGMGGKHQKLQDFFTNQKLSRLEKEETWLLTNQDDAIIWILGLRLDERFKIQTTTEKVCNIHWIK